MKQQTALSFFLMKMVDLEIGKTFYPNQRQDLQDAFKQAKQMEKEQIVNAINDSWNMAKHSNFADAQAEQYYHETYNN